LDKVEILKLEPFEVVAIRLGEGHESNMIQVLDQPLILDQRDDLELTGIKPVEKAKAVL
jgi:hypothetical protein